MHRALVAGGLVIGLAIGNVFGSLGWAPTRVTGQATSMDERVGQLEQRVTTLEQDVQDLSVRPAPAPAPAAAAAAAPVQIACRDMNTESRTSSYSNGGSFTIKTTTNVNGVDGLTLVEVSDGYDTTSDYSIPTWLLDSYGGNLSALLRDIRDGQLTNRRSAESCRR
jgi:hypothetical protein